MRDIGLWATWLAFWCGWVVWLRIVIETWQLGVLRRDMARQSEAFLAEAADMDDERATLAALRHGMITESIALRQAHAALLEDRAQIDADAAEIARQDAEIDACVRQLQEALGLMRCGAHDEAEEILGALAPARTATGGTRT